MSKDIPLRGAVGFELFNNADFGMTEFAQKVNYQRALQGEITRTIMSVEDVQFARVHLAIPEQGVFRKNASKPKASITLTLKPGRTLRQEQVTGIQRLVSAALPDIAAQDVTIVNQSGVALTRVAGAEGELESGSARLDSKRAAEEYLARKASAVLDRMFGPGQAMVTVDVVLNHDQSRVTTEDVLPSRSDSDANPTGVVVRQRSYVRDSTAATTVSDTPRRDANSGHLEIDYQVGHRTEQVVTAPGAVQRLGVAIVVRAALDKAQLERVRNLVAVAVGFDGERGDGIAVYSMEQVASAPADVKAEALPVSLPATPLPAAVPAQAVAPVSLATPAWQGMPLAPFAIAALAAMTLVTLLIARRRRRHVSSGPARALTGAEREAMLVNVRQWVSEGAKRG
jgi:flagellar M-ring protein FliF